MNNGDVKAYILTFLAPNVNLAALNQYLFDSADIIAFWNYIPLVYCVKSRSSASDLTPKLRAFLPDSYLLAEINSFNMNGILPKSAWDWFYLNHHEKHRAPNLSPAWNPLAGSALSPFGLAGLLNPPDKR